MVKWYEVHQQLANALVIFYNNSIRDGKKPGQALYQLLTGDSRFIARNQWVEKFSQQFGVQSLDPIHVFFSLHPNKMTIDNRQKRVKLLYELLLNQPIDDEIDFAGCPAPAIIQILSARAEHHQEEVWDLFINIKSNGRNGLVPGDFSRYKSWYGIEFKSFTTFLFYIDSDHFLPLESNVEEFLIKIELIASVQKSYTGYIEVLHIVDPFNSNKDIGYGFQGIFRELSFWAYRIARDPKLVDSYSEGIVALIRYVHKYTVPVSALTEKEIDFQFRLIAIRALPGCDPSILNNLHRDQSDYYYFEKTIEISNKEIKYFPERDLQLFHLEEHLRLNITAIVGRNGSGKSSLIELLFRIINNVSYQHRHDLGTDDLEFVPRLFAELYYVYKSHLYKLELKDQEISIEEFELREKTYHLIKKSGFTKEHFKRFFYTIAVNYSHYALNAREIGTWINGLFHKNDGYQTPVVINPMRTNGNIDINKENSLTTSRLISILLTPVDEDNPGLRQLTDKQQAVEIKVTLKKKQEFVLFETAEGKKVKLEQLQTNQSQIFKIIREVFNLPSEIVGAAPLITKRLKQYMVRKLVRMALNYYPGFFDREKIEFSSLENVRLLVDKIKTNETHSAYKFKQAINYWKHELWPKTKTFTIDIGKDGDRVDNFKSTVENGKLITLIPPAIFDFEIMLENAGQPNSSFSKLSSGEKQFIYSVSSLLYHLSNLDSVHYTDEYIAYDTVNIVLDEIELYYHPEWQKRYVNYLLTHISSFELPNIRAVNICFVTHSPYILSDIPDNYTLKLSDERLNTVASRTFAANIHDLLANDFFLQDGFMGEFARKKINETIRFLNIQSIWARLKKIEEGTNDKDKNAVRIQLIAELVLWKVIEETEEAPVEEQAATIAKQEQKQLPSLSEIEHLIQEQHFMNQEAYRKIIEVIGEPILRHKLMDMYHDLFGKEEAKRKRLLELAEELNYQVFKN
ncbi:MAG: AAA family ATPase [Bacteroidetes bacterium]|nr:AAA family ATPase [Bacteroidota bacterium]